jgi:digeranylgeranylglycerophospholipid reductase
MTSVPDAIVVGGGPCGSTVAAGLARQGANTVVFEEHEQVGIPSHCAGHLSINGLRQLKLFPLPKGVIENTFCGATFYSPGCNSFSIRFSSPITCAVDRALFDQYIAERAKTYGATYWPESRVEQLLIKDGYVKGVIVSRKNETEKVLARIVVDAEGISSRLVRLAGLETLDRRRLVNAVEAEVEGTENLETNMVEVFLGHEYSPGLYAWLIPKRDKRAKIGLAAKSGNPKELLEKFMLKHPVASAKLRKARILQIAFHPITLGGPIPMAYSNGFLAVGDAASQVKPTTGGGVILGMTCAEIAAQVASRSLQNGDVSAEFLGQYQRRCDQVMRLDMNVMLRARRMLDAMSDRRIDGFISLCASLGLDKTLLGVKDLDFQGKSLLRALRNPKMLAVSGYLLFFYLAANL